MNAESAKQAQELAEKCGYNIDLQRRFGKYAYVNVLAVAIPEEMVTRVFIDLVIRKDRKEGPLQEGQIDCFQTAFDIKSDDNVSLVFREKGEEALALLLKRVDEGKATTIVQECPEENIVR